VIVGNPPWARPGWNEGLVLADIDPLYTGLSASDAKKVLGEALPKAPPVRREGRTIPAVKAFLHDFVSTRGAMEVTSSEVMNPFAGEGRNNLYRCFIDLSFRLVSPQGYAALIHQDGHLGDPKSGAFRRHWYARATKHFEFINRMKARNFMEVDHNVRFSLNIYRGEARDPQFDQFTYAFTATQIEDSYADMDGIGPVPSLKNSEGNWDTRGHRARIMRINLDALTVIHALSEEETVPVEETRFIQPYSAQMLSVFTRFASFAKISLYDLNSEDSTYVKPSRWGFSHMLDEAARQKDGTIERVTGFRDQDRLVLQGPLIHIGNPNYKSAKARSITNADYDVVDLTNIADNYRPRTNFLLKLNQDERLKRLPKCRWDSSKSHVDFFRVAMRRQLAQSGERTLISAIITPGVTHVSGIVSVGFQDECDVLNFASTSHSLAFDFLIKSAGASDLNETYAARLPYLVADHTSKSRALRLACITTPYATLWNRHASTLDVLPWSSPDHRLLLEGPVEGPATWDRTAGLRTEFARRMALVEIDVLVAQALGLTLEQLIEIYRIYFPVLQENEAGTWYDQNGRIVWTCSKGLPGVGWLDDRGKSPGRAAWERILADNPPELTCTAIDDTMPGGPREVIRHFAGPFTQCDRIEDYRRAWAHFERLKSAEAAE
jgi:hypothetical protein